MKSRDAAAMGVVLAVGLLMAVAAGASAGPKRRPPKDTWRTRIVTGDEGAASLLRMLDTVGDVGDMSWDGDILTFDWQGDAGVPRNYPVHEFGREFARLEPSGEWKRDWRKELGVS